MSAYGVTALDGLPARVTVYEVGARDGLQNEKGLIPTDVKAEFVRQLVAAGHTAVETTSFVSPTWVPQLADAADLLALLDLPEGVRAALTVSFRHDRTALLHGRVPHHLLGPRHRRRWHPRAGGPLGLLSHVGRPAVRSRHARRVSSRRRRG